METPMNPTADKTPRYLSHVKTDLSNGAPQLRRAPDCWFLVGCGGPQPGLMYPARCARMISYMTSHRVSMSMAGASSYLLCPKFHLAGDSYMPLDFGA